MKKRELEKILSSLSYDQVCDFAFTVGVNK